MTRLSRDSETVADHEEDPGIEPDTGFTIQQIADEEMQFIVRAAQSRALAIQDHEQQRRWDIAP